MKNECLAANLSKFCLQRTTPQRHIHLMLVYCLRLRCKKATWSRWNKNSYNKNLEEKQLEQKQLHSNQPEQKNNITALIPNINIKNMMERYMCCETLHNQHSFTAWIQHVRILTPTRNFNSWMKQSLHNKIGTEIRILSSC